MTMHNNPDVMPFGRYAGLLYYELVIEHPDYVKWLLAQPWLDAAVAARLRAEVASWQAERAAERLRDEDER